MSEDELKKQSILRDLLEYLTGKRQFDNPIAEFALGAIEPGYGDIFGGMAGSMGDVADSLKGFRKAYPKAAASPNPQDLTDLSRFTSNEVSGIFQKDFGLPVDLQDRFLNDMLGPDPGMTGDTMANHIGDIYKSFENISQLDPTLLSDNNMLRKMNVGVPPQSAKNRGYYTNPLEFKDVGVHGNKVRLQEVWQDFKLGSTQAPGYIFGDLNPRAKISNVTSYALDPFSVKSPGRTAAHEVAHSWWALLPPELKAEWVNRYWDNAPSISNLGPKQGIPALDLVGWANRGDDYFKPKSASGAGIPYTEYGGGKPTEDWAVTAEQLFGGGMIAPTNAGSPKLHGYRDSLMTEMLRARKNYPPHVVDFDPTYLAMKRTSEPWAQSFRPPVLPMAAK